MDSSCASLSPDDFSLLARATRLNPDNSEDIRKRLGQKVNWPCFLKLAHDCGIPSLLYRQIKSNGWDSVVPESVMEHLKGEYIRVHGINMAYYRELIAIMSEFRREGIHAAVLKGAASARYLYEDIGRRSFGDVDILVHESDFLQADRLLRRRLELTKSIPPDGLSRRCAFHYLYISRKPPRLKFELHWRLFPDDSRIDYPQELFLDKAVPWEDDGIAMRILSPAHFFIHLCLHFTGHSFSSLRDLWDLAWMIDKNKVPWNRLDKLSSGSIRNRIYYSLCLVQSVFAMDITGPIDRFSPTPGIRRFFPKVLDHKGISTKIAERKKNLRVYIAFLMLPDWKARLRFLLCLMIPGICWLTIFPDNENPSPFRHRGLIFLRGVRLIGYLFFQMAVNIGHSFKSGLFTAEERKIAKVTTKPE